MSWRDTRWAMGRWVREVFAATLGLLLARPRRPVLASECSRILVVRLDERVGNVVMLTSFLSSLRERFPRATVHLLGHVRAQPLLGLHPALDGFVPFDKRRLLARHGPLRLPLALWRQRYDVAIDVSNPTVPSVTQTLLARLSGARHTVGFDHPGFGRWLSAPVLPPASGHEIAMRQTLLGALPGGPVPQWRPPSLGYCALTELDTQWKAMGAYVVLNLGARTQEKQLTQKQYVELARAMGAQPLVCTFGPAERPLAEAVVAEVFGARLAPPTNLWQLGACFARARRVVTCDTGPMHLSVASGTPTLGLFVSTSPARYGYASPPHLAVDVAGSPWEQVVELVRAFARPDAAPTASQL